MEEQIKLCSYGKHEVSISGFSRLKSGTLSSWCKKCSSDDAKRRYQEKRAAQLLKERGEPPSELHRWCTMGSHYVEISNFGQRSGRDHLEGSCIDCIRESKKEYTRGYRKDKTLLRLQEESVEKSRWCKKGEHFADISLFRQRKDSEIRFGSTCMECFGIDKDVLMSRPAKPSDNHKWCVDGHWEDKANFYKQKDRADGLNSRCSPCKKKYARTKSKHKVYSRLYEEQNGKCAICPVTEKENGRSLAVDHDHRCCPSQSYCENCARALLCDAHNKMLGFAHDNPEELIAGAEYLQKWFALHPSL